MADFDLSQLLGGNMGGLLNPRESGDVNQNTIMGIAAGLLKAAGPSPYKAKLTTLSGLGEGLAGGLAARKSAFDDILKQKYVAAQTAHLNDEQVLKAAQMATNFQANNLPVPPVIQHILDAASGRAGMGGGGIGSGPPGLPGGAFAQAPSTPGAPPAPAGQPAPGAGGSPQFPPGSPAARLQALGINPAALAATGPAADIAKSAVDANVKATDPAIEENERRKKVFESNVARSEKLYPALVAVGHEGYAARDNSAISTALANDPGFYSGQGQPFNEAWQKFKVAMGADPNLAFSQEAFRKITAANVNEQISGMKAQAAEMGGAAGRIFQNQTVLMEKASQNLDNTPAANRFLANLQARAAENNIAIGDAATAYVQKHGILDAGFDAQMSKYLRDHPLFKPAELADLRKVATSPGSPGAPAAPAPAPSWMPPGAKQAPDGHYYIMQNGKTYRVEEK